MFYMTGNNIYPGGTRQMSRDIKMSCIPHESTSKTGFMCIDHHI